MMRTVAMWHPVRFEPKRDVGQRLAAVVPWFQWTEKLRDIYNAAFHLLLNQRIDLSSRRCLPSSRRNSFNSISLIVWAHNSLQVVGRVRTEVADRTSRLPNDLCCDL